MDQTDEVTYPSMFADVVEQLTPRHVLHDHEEICGCTYHLIPKIHICTRINFGLFYLKLQPF